MKSKLTSIAASLIGLVASDATAETTLKVNDKAPDFTLSDENGKEHTLSTQLKDTKVAILFYRSGDW